MASPDRVRGYIVKAFVILESDIMATVELKEELKNHVKHYMVPYKYSREIEFIPTLPKTVSGKVKRVVLGQLEKEKNNWRRKKIIIKKLVNPVYCIQHRCK